MGIVIDKSKLFQQKRQEVEEKRGQAIKLKVKISSYNFGKPLKDPPPKPE